jgi:SAM-dependent methyltransferase
VSRLGQHRRDWEELAELDPLWAIVSSPAARHGRWDEAAFFATGEKEIAAAMTRLDALGWPRQRRRALDFGCGVGRVTRAMGERFDEVLGVDISSKMIERAGELNGGRAGLSFAVNDAPDLAAFDDRRFDLVYSRVVLQHVPGRALARRYVEDFVRLLEAGGLAVFQIPTRIPLRYRFLVTRRLYVAMRAVGLSPRRLHAWGLHPIRMQHAAEDDVVAWVRRAGGRVLAVDRSRSRSGVEHGTFYAARADADA